MSKRVHHNPNHPRLFDPFDGCGPARPGPAPKRPRRKKMFGGDTEGLAEVTALVRGAMIAALDESFCGPAGGEPGPLGKVLWQELGSFDLRAHGLAVLQAIQLALFPEEFGEPAAGPGLVPPGGPKRVGYARLEAFARTLRAGPGKGTPEQARAG